VRYIGTAAEGPFEQHDLSGFCASEDHAVKVGAYILAKRRHVTHRLQLGVRPDAFNGSLASGDLVRVRLERVPSTGAASVHDYLYEVDRIGNSITGEVRLELTHFPVDSSLASVVAQEVNAASGGGFLLSTGLTGVTCDINSSSDTSVPADNSLDPSEWALPDSGAFEQDLAAIDEFDEGGFDEGGFDGAGDNAYDSIGGSPYPGGGEPGLSYSGDPENPQTGDRITAPSICPGGIVRFYRLDSSVPGGKLFLQESSSNYTYTMIINDVDYSVYSEVSCPDPSSPTGYSDPIAFSPTPVVQAGPPPQVTGTVPPPGNTTPARLVIQRSSGQYGVSTEPAFNPPTFTCGTPFFINVTGGTFALEDVISVEGMVFLDTRSPQGQCGYNTIGLQVTRAGGVVYIDGTGSGTANSITSYSPTYSLTWSGPGAVPYEP
jgi:hypothetical protein